MARRAGARPLADAGRPLPGGTRRLISADLILSGRIPYLEWGYTQDPWAEQRAALTRARALGSQLVLPGHGDVTENVDRLFDAAIGGIEAAPERLKASVQGSPRTAYEAMLDVLGTDSTFYRRHAALSGAVCMLERLAGQGELVADDRNGIRFYGVPS